MALAATVKHFLDSHEVSYRVLLHERTAALKEAAHILGIESRRVIQTVLLRDIEGVVMALLPLDHQIDFRLLSQHTHRVFERISDKEADRFFQDCEPGSHPALGNAYGIRLLLDKNIDALETVYMEVGCHTLLAQLKLEDFQFLTMGSLRCAFAVSAIEKMVLGS